MSALHGSEKTISKGQSNACRIIKNQRPTASPSVIHLNVVFLGESVTAVVVQASIGSHYRAISRKEKRHRGESRTVGDLVVGPVDEAIGDIVEGPRCFVREKSSAINCDWKLLKHA